MTTQFETNEVIILEESAHLILLALIIVSGSATADMESPAFLIPEAGLEGENANAAFDSKRNERKEKKFIFKNCRNLGTCSSNEILCRLTGLPAVANTFFL